MNLSQVLPQLFVGSCPNNLDDIDRLKTDHGITAVLSLQTDDELDHTALSTGRIAGHCDELGIGVERIPVEAFAGEEGLRNLCLCVAAVEDLLRGGQVVYLHCHLGTVRSPGVVVAYLVWRQGWKLTDAMEYVRRCHPCHPESVAVLVEAGDLVAA
jgi:protein-tyrosine phosphatase